MEEEERQILSEKEPNLKEGLPHVRTIAAQELEVEHRQLPSRCEARGREKDAAAKAEEESTARSLREPAEGARRRTEELTEECRALCAPSGTPHSVGRSVGRSEEVAPPSVGDGEARTSTERAMRPPSAIAKEGMAVRLLRLVQPRRSRRGRPVRDTPR